MDITQLLAELHDLGNQVIEARAGLESQRRAEAEAVAMLAAAESARLTSESLLADRLMQINSKFSEFVTASKA